MSSHICRRTVSPVLPVVSRADNLGHQQRLDLEVHAQGVPHSPEPVVGPVLGDQGAAEADHLLFEEPGVLLLLGHEQGQGGDIVGIVGPCAAGLGKERGAVAALAELEVGQ
jgi:hypothetical protein